MSKFLHPIKFIDNRFKQEFIMKKFLLSYMLFCLYNTVCIGQCAEAIFKDYRNSDRPFDVMYRKTREARGNKDIFIHGGYIHKVDSVKIYKCNAPIYSNKISNELPEMDGSSFGTELFFDENEEQIIFLQLDNCHYLIEIPPKTIRIYIQKRTPQLSIFFY